ncbi:hypothetical protein C8U37_10221 [Trichococcus patagoniensis]|uniref:Uncharacterized protein n=1 Tax=Trichococcus patagoniensis TaxID=382641 RepID=A0A2T5IQ24_9LACT|nr:hypothetical protein C8U37_10221 [Trichococcus patagoniensis]
MGVLSGVLRFSVFVLSTVAGALGCSSYRPGRMPDRWAFCLVFCGFRYSFCRQMHALSGVQVTVLGGCPTDGCFIWCFAVFGIRSVDSCGRSRVFRLPSWADARQMGVLSGVLRFSVFIQSTDACALGCSGYRPGRMPDRWVFCLVFGGFLYSFCRQLRALSGVPDTVLGGCPTEVRFVWCFAVFGIRSVDSCRISREFRIPSWADARHKDPNTQKAPVAAFSAATGAFLFFL